MESAEAQASAEAEGGQVSENKYFKPTEGKYIALGRKVWERLGRPPKKGEPCLGHYAGESELLDEPHPSDCIFGIDTHEGLRELIPPIPPDGFMLLMEPGADGVMAPAFRRPKDGDWILCEPDRAIAEQCSCAWASPPAFTINDGYRWILTPLPKPEPTSGKDASKRTWAGLTPWDGPERRKDHEMREWWRHWPANRDVPTGVREAYRRGQQSTIHLEIPALRERAINAEALLRRAAAFLDCPFSSAENDLRKEIDAFLPPPPADKRKGERRKVSAEVRWHVEDRAWMVWRDVGNGRMLWRGENRAPHDRRKGGTQ